MITAIITSVLGFAITILIVVSVHEYGHLLMARLCRVFVLRYSIGFGPPILSWRSKKTHTNYVLAPIPLGGYCALLGQDDVPPREGKEKKADGDAPGMPRAEGGGSADAASEQLSQSQESGERHAGQGAGAGQGDMDRESREEEAKRKRRDRVFDRYFRIYSYASKPVYKRIIIAAGGPLFNFILSAALLLALAIMGYGQYRPVLKPVPGGELHQQGARAGDIIVGVAGQKVRNVRDIAMSSLAEIIENREVTLTLESGRTGETFETRLANTGDGDGESFFQEVFIKEVKMLGPPAVVGQLSPGYPVADSELRIGDLITSIAGAPVEDFNDIGPIVSSRANQDLPATVVRDGQSLAITIPVFHYPGKPDLGYIGVGADRSGPAFAQWREQMRFHPGILELPGIVLGEFWQLFSLTFRSVKWLIEGDVSIDSLKGPVGIADFAGKSIESGIMPFIYFIALVSVSIGVLNLLPVPVLDGGHILMLCYEGLRGKPVPERAAAALTWMGVALIGSLLIFTIFNDISSLL